MNKIIRSGVCREGFTPEKEKYELHIEVGFGEGNEHGTRKTKPSEVNVMTHDQLNQDA